MGKQTTYHKSKYIVLYNEVYRYCRCVHEYYSCDHEVCVMSGTKTVFTIQHFLLPVNTMLDHDEYAVTGLHAPMHSLPVADPFCVVN